MKKSLFFLLALVITQTLTAQETSPIIPRAGWEFKLGFGPTYLNNIGGVKARDVYQAQVGLAQNFGINLFYDVLQKEKCNLRLTSGYEILEFQGVVYTDAQNKYSVSNLYSNIPLKLSLSSGNANKIQYYSSLAGSVAIPIVTNTIRETQGAFTSTRVRESTSATNFYVTFGGGIRLRVNDILTFSIGAESISKLGARNKASESALIFTQGVGFNF